MKKFITRSITSLALVSMIGVAAPAVAFAGNTTTTTHNATSTAAMAHEAAMDAYNTSAQAIRATFRTSVATAKSTLASALSTATTADGRDAARDAFVVSIKAAVSVRKASFKALGPLPVK